MVAGPSAYTGFAMLLAPVMLKHLATFACGHFLAMSSAPDSSLPPAPFRAAGGLVQSITIFSAMSVDPRTSSTAGHGSATTTTPPKAIACAGVPALARPAHAPSV